MGMRFLMFETLCTYVTVCGCLCGTEIMVQGTVVLWVSYIPEPRPRVAGFSCNQLRQLISCFMLNCTLRRGCLWVGADVMFQPS